MNELDATPDRELVLRRLTDPFPAGPGEYAPALWVAATAAAVLLAAVWVVRLYRRDARVLGWAGAVPLAGCRLLVYLLLAAAFLLPAIQTWERSEKRSKVVFVVDVSPSVTEVADERPSDPKAKPTARLDKLLDTLTDDRLGLLKTLVQKNPVTVYRFGGRLDEESVTFDAGGPAWTRAEWAAWLRGDLKAWLLRPLTPAGRELLAKSPAWDGDAPGTPEWAAGWAKRPDAEVIPAGLSDPDKATLAAARGRLEKRSDVVRVVGQGTNLPDALAAAVNREAGNLVQAVVAFSDGRSTAGADAGFRQLKERAARERIPVFTVAVGEARDMTAITITDVQAADRAPPDEPFKVSVEADGVGLADAEAEVKLGLFAPGKSPKDKDGKPAPPDVELTRPLKFAGTTAPPHGAAEFVVDAEAADFPEPLTEPAKKAGKKRQLRQGTWTAVARIARDKREVTADEWHVSPPRAVQVLDKPLRVLLFAGAATREYQTLRTLLVRETQQNRAELSIYLQSAAGRAGTAVQDVPPERLLTKFPGRLDTSGRGEADGDRFGNLNQYDLVIAFDPDWSELSADQVRNVQEWVDNLGGGLIFVAGPVNSFQLARADEDGRLKPLLDLLPVVLDDAVLVKTRPVPRTPRRLALKPNPEFDVLRLEDDKPDDPVAGWAGYFGSDKPDRGFFAYYPVKAAKPVSTTLAELVEPGEGGESPGRRPWLVTAQTKRGRGVFLASGELWRLRTYDPDYYDRLWVKLARYAAGNRDVRESRGRVLVGKEFPAGAVVRVQARLLAPNARPYPPDAISPKFTVARFTAGGEKVPGVKDEGPFELRPRRSGGEFDGYYTGQFLADPARFPPGDSRYRISVEVPDAVGESVTADLTLRRADPELDNTRPDFAALEDAAGTLDEVRGRVTDPAVLKVLEGGPGGAAGKLAARLAERDKLAALPACVEAVSQTSRSRGPVQDLWDRGPTLSSGDRRAEVSWLLIAAVGLLGVEWLVRKLARLA
jgi:hypothetical protein